jgi:hypothetical protein
LKECFKCKYAGFPGHLIDFEKIGEDTATGKNIWKLLNKDGTEHKHELRSAGQLQQQQQQQQQQPPPPNNNSYKNKDSIKICKYCNGEITFHEDRKALSGKKIPLNPDNSIHDCLLNPFNQAKQGRSR